MNRWNRESWFDGGLYDWGITWKSTRKVAVVGGGFVDYNSKVLENDGSTIEVTLVEPTQLTTPALSAILLLAVSRECLQSLMTTKHCKASTG